MLLCTAGNISPIRLSTRCIGMAADSVPLLFASRYGGGVYPLNSRSSDTYQCDKEISAILELWCVFYSLMPIVYPESRGIVAIPLPSSEGGGFTTTDIRIDSGRGVLTIALTHTSFPALIQIADELEGSSWYYTVSIAGGIPIVSNFGTGSLLDLREFGRWCTDKLSVGWTTEEWISLIQLALLGTVGIGLSLIMRQIEGKAPLIRVPNHDAAVRLAALTEGYAIGNVVMGQSGMMGENELRRRIRDLNVDWQTGIECATEAMDLKGHRGPYLLVKHPPVLVISNPPITFVSLNGGTKPQVVGTPVSWEFIKKKLENTDHLMESPSDEWVPYPVGMGPIIPFVPGKVLEILRRKNPLFELVMEDGAKWIKNLLSSQTRESALQ